MKNFSRLASRLLVVLVALGSIGLSSCKKSDDSTTVTGNWVKKSTYLGPLTSAAVSFTINNIAYVGTGIDASGIRHNEFYSYNPTTNSWTPQAPMPAAAGVRSNAVAFTAAGKGYVGTGYNGTAALSDFWEFNPSGTTTITVGTTTTTVPGSWRKVADLVNVLGGSARYNSVAGNVGDAGFVACGFDGLNNRNDFFKFTPPATTSATDLGSWSTTAGFPGDKRTGAFAFTANGQLYVGGGVNNGLYLTDFYSYNPVGNGTWTQHRNLANQTTGSDIYDFSGVTRTTAVAFTISNLGYVTVGSYNSLLSSTYVYDTAADTWTLKNPFLGSTRNSAVAFTINGIGYVGLGRNGTQPFDDFWTFDPNAAQQ